MSEGLAETIRYMKQMMEASKQEECKFRSEMAGLVTDLVKEVRFLKESQETIKLVPESVVASEDSILSPMSDENHPQPALRELKTYVQQHLSDANLAKLCHESGAQSISNLRYFYDG